MKTKFEVKFTPRFLRRIKALDKEIQVRIVREVDILKTNPYAGKSLRGEWKGGLFFKTWRLSNPLSDQRKQGIPVGRRSSQAHL